ncbi:MAG: polysaccharide deacetylase family protein [Candidatus Latescibacteria bacterium]|nr:polysaccharide deacetylase family protein [Candidatus Latescibacterota bacterium]
MRAGIRRLLLSAGYRLGLIQAAARAGDRWVVRGDRRPPSFERRGEEGFLVLIYHRVDDGDSAFRIETTRVKLFDRQMRYLGRHFRVLALDDILHRLRSGVPLPGRCAAVTFDDGYEDNFLHAFPILKRHRIPATLFPAVGSIDTGKALWFDRVLRAFETTSRTRLETPWGAAPLELPTRAERARAAEQMLHSLMPCGNGERLARVEAVVSLLAGGSAPAPPVPMLRWSQIRAMAEGGVSIGSHTVSHPVLTTVPPEEAARELRESKRTIEVEIGRPVSLFAYPVGKREHYSEAIKRLVADAGYTAALTTRSGANGPSHDRYELRRIRSWEPTLPAFALTLTRHRLLADAGD